MSSVKQILCLVGCLGENSHNRRLLEQLAKVAGPRAWVYAELGGLPFFDPDAAEAPSSVQVLRQAVIRADAVIFGCPEYGHSLPGVLKNGIDWLIGSGELEGKQVALTASTASSERGLRGLSALAQTLGAVSAKKLWDRPIVRGTEDTEVPSLLAAIDAAPMPERTLVYFNPACSKSRAVRELLEGEGIVAEYRYYLTLAPTRFELEGLVRRLGKLPVRTGEAIYAELGLSNVSTEDLLDAVVAHPVLLERPLVVRGDRAVIARPPELARALFS